MFCWLDFTNTATDCLQGDVTECLQGIFKIFSGHFNTVILPTMATVAFGKLYA